MAMRKRPPGAQPPAAPEEPRRPLLGGGELLREKGSPRKGRDGKYHPVAVGEAYEALAPRAEALARAVAEIPEELAAPHLVFEATLLPNYIASSYFPEELFERAGLYPVGMREETARLTTRKRTREQEPTKTVILAGSRAGVESFARSMTRKPAVSEDRDWLEFRKLADVRLPDPKRVVRSLPNGASAGDVLTWEAVLTTVGQTEAEREAWAAEAFDKWNAYVKRLGGAVDVPFRRTVGGLIFVPVQLQVGAIHAAARFNVLRAVRPMPSLRALPDMGLRSAERAAPAPLPPTARPLYEGRVAIFDGGVPAGSPHFAGFVTSHDLTPEPPVEKSLHHGCAVTSAFLYGPLEVGSGLARPPVLVDHYRVLPPPKGSTFDEASYWLLDRIQETVARTKPRYVNLSIGPEQSVEDAREPSRWTATLDALAAEHDVLFVTAAGNNGTAPAADGQNRVQVPADMVNGIGVGACTERSPQGLVRSIYSAMGPGRAGQRVQPLGIAFGGSEGGSLFHAVGHGGDLITRCGTSYAAPFAMRSFVTLGGQLGSRASPEAIRAFAAHFAERKVRGHDQRQLGYGRFQEDYAQAWECAPNEVTVVYQHRIERKGSTAMRFPFPRGVPAGTPIELEWTFAYQSETDSADGADYTLSGFDPMFRPHEGRRTLRDTNTDEVLAELELPRDAAKYAKLAATRQVKLGDPKALSGWRMHRTEQALKDAGKWETLFRGRAKLDAQELFRPRLDLQYLARWKGVLVKAPRPLPITLVVTLRAPKGVPLYDLVRSEFYVLVPLSVQARVQT